MHDVATRPGAGPSALTPPSPPTEVDHGLIHRRRWAVLVIVSISLMVISLDNTILNVALPTLSRALRADDSQLQWMVDAYTLVFAGLLLTAGSLGDRFGRKRCLAIGLAIFGLSSAAAALATSSGGLIATRAVMGVGAAFIMPATLSIIANVFTIPAERIKAFAVWAGVAALGLGLGPVTGGFLLQHFYWGSVFLVNVFIAGAALVGGRFIIPRLPYSGVARLDPLGAILSIGGLGALIYAIIEGPQIGWSSPRIVVAFVVAAVILPAFVAWELHTDEPMIEMRFFRNPRFTAASAALTAVFFSMFGLMFVMTQLLQFVLGYDALGAGVRVLELSITFMLFAQLSARVAPRLGAKAVVGFGSFTVAAGLLLGATFGDHSGYGLLAVTLSLTGLGMGCVSAVATESIMSSLPRHKTGVGSAVNDSIRQTGGALGVAIVGSFLAGGYRSRIIPALKGTGLPPAALHSAQASYSAAVKVAQATGGQRGAEVLAAARHVFVHAAAGSLLPAALTAAIGGVVTLLYLPSHAKPVAEDSGELASAAQRPVLREARPAPRPSPAVAPIAVTVAARPEALAPADGSADELTAAVSPAGTPGYERSKLGAALLAFSGGQSALARVQEALAAGRSPSQDDLARLASARSALADAAVALGGDPATVTLADLEAQLAAREVAAGRRHAMGRLAGVTGPSAGSMELASLAAEAARLAASDAWSPEDHARSAVLLRLVELADVASDGGDDERIFALDAELRSLLDPGAVPVVLAGARGRLVLPAEPVVTPTGVPTGVQGGYSGGGCEGKPPGRRRTFAGSELAEGQRPQPGR